MEILGLFGLILAIVFFIFSIHCMRKEKELSGFYKEIGVCGRWYAYITADLIFSGALSLIALLANSIWSIAKKTHLPEHLFSSFGMCTFLLVIGIVLFRRAYNRCPEVIDKKLFWDMLIIMLGLTMRICLFILRIIFQTWWAMYLDVCVIEGETVYVYPGSNLCFDADGDYVGDTNDERTVLYKI